MRRMVPTKTIDVLQNISYDESKKAIEIGVNLEVDGTIKENGTLPTTSLEFNNEGEDIFEVENHGDGIYKFSSTASSGYLEIVFPNKYIIITTPDSLSEMASKTYVSGYSLGAIQFNYIDITKKHLNDILLIKKNDVIYIQETGEL